MGQRAQCNACTFGPVGIIISVCARNDMQESHAHGHPPLDAWPTPPADMAAAHDADCFGLIDVTVCEEALHGYCRVEGIGHFRAR
jgi:hypothetical protein